MCSLYCAYALAEAMKMERGGLAPYSLAWRVAALPEDGVVRAVLLRGLRGFVSARVKIMRQRQLLYNARGLRLDGNFKLAKIINVADDEEAYTVVFGICGLDGSLLVPLLPLRAEDWGNIVTILQLLFYEIRDLMLAQRFSLEETMPVFIATDNHFLYSILSPISVQIHK